MTKFRDSLSVDLITFFHPSFWGEASRDSLVAWATAHRKDFWTKLLDSAAESGVRNIELTFSPMGWRDAVEAFGSLEAFSAELRQRELTVISSFFSGLANGDWRSEAGVEAILAGAMEQCDFLSRAGGSALVISVPLRTTAGAEHAVPMDWAHVTKLAAIINRMGQGAFRRGIRLALHPEAHSMLWHGRDHDAFMLATDPTYVWLCPDAAHISLSGTDPVALAARHAERIWLSHWKDAEGLADRDAQIDENIYRRNGTLFRELGTGAVDWLGWHEVLLKAPYTGPAILELDAAKDPVGAVKRAVAFAENIERTSNSGRSA